MKRRLFKVIVQTIYLDENDREIATQPVAVARDDWDDFVTKHMPSAIAAFCALTDDEPPPAGT
jgi:hypothetical protein